MDKLTIETVTLQVKRILSIGCTESSHSLEDNLNEGFIKGIALGLYTFEEINQIAPFLKELLDMNLDRWYA